MRSSHAPVRWLALATVLLLAGTVALGGGAAARAEARPIPGASSPALRLAGRPHAVTEWAEPAADSAIGLSGDDVASRMIEFGFPFHFYGRTYTAASLTSNGVISLDHASFHQSANTPLPYSSFGALIAPFWTDLMLYENSALYAARGGTAPNRWFAATWDRVGFAGNSSARISFQMLSREPVS